MKSQIKIFAKILFVLLFFSGCYYDIEEELYPMPSACDTTNITYLGSVLPIIQANCYSCHSASANQGNVILEGYSNLNIYASNGKLMGTIKYSTGFSPMPKNSNKLSSCEILTINKWIENGTLNN